MGEFINNNIIWISPILSIVLAIFIKICSKPNFISLEFRDFFDFGFDLSITSTLAMTSGIKRKEDLWILILAYVLILIIIAIVSRVGWDKNTEQLKLIGVIIPDILGIFMLIITSLYLRGAI